MHKLYDFACDELEELERKAAEKGLSAGEVEYADKLTELKKNILKIEMLEDEGYSAEYHDDRMSYARGRTAKRDRMGRYSRANDEIVDQLRRMEETAKDDRTRHELKKLIDKMEHD